MVCAEGEPATQTAVAPAISSAPVARDESAQLLCGFMYEDWRVEAEAFAPESRVFAAASAGCTALALADCGHAVTAVDPNAEQIRYCRERLNGGEMRSGAVDELLALGRRLLPRAGITRARLQQFLELRDPAEQLAYWRGRLRAQDWRALIACAFSPLILRSVYAAPLMAALPARFPEVLRARFERLWSRHANRDNPYAWQLWLGRSLMPSRVLEKRRNRPRFECCDAVEFLEAAAPASFDAFTCSSLLDSATPEYTARLWRAVQRAAAPGAVAISRSIGLPRSPAEDQWAARDRSGIWGAIAVTCV